MSLAFSTHPRPRRSLPHLPVQNAIRLIAILLISLCSVVGHAASIRGQVVDTTGAKITGANVVAVANGKPVASAISTADGSFEIDAGSEGRFFLVVTANTFRQLQTPDFYAGSLDSIERK